MACDAEDCGFQMLNDDEIVTSVQEESDLVDDERMKTRTTTTTKVARVHQRLTPFLCYRHLWSGTYNNQSAILLNYCCSRESETLQRKNEGVQWYSKNERLFSPIKVKLRHFAPILLFLQARFSHGVVFNIRIVSDFIYCMDRIRFSVIRIIAYPNGVPFDSG
ncbi:uncharacterized protein TNCV_1193741 [Trichonephila clavipes]|nr:uncharacterized protein TNCV_1193741 [Trichonephila clavipes]